MTNDEDLFDQLLRVADLIDYDSQITEFSEQSMIELKNAAFMPLYDEFYGGRVVNSIEIHEKAMKKRLKDPKGGLTAAGRAYFKRTEGANLKPGVRGPADTPEKMRRKGSFLTRFFTNPSGPMKDEKGRATRLALSAAAWGEPVPQDAQDAARLAAKGRRLLERYANAKKKKKADDIQDLLEWKSLETESSVHTGDTDGIGELTMLNIESESRLMADEKLARRIVAKNDLALRQIRTKNMAKNPAKNAEEKIAEFEAERQRQARTSPVRRSRSGAKQRQKRGETGNRYHG